VIREAGATETQIKDDTVAAMKAGDKERVGALRMLTAALKKERIDHGGAVDEASELAVLKRERKRRLEATEAYDRAGRPELAAKERQEEALIAAYLPQELSAEELARLVDAAIAETGASTPKEMGAVMKAVMAKVAGRADGKQVNALVRQRLGA
jgi:uncharacterized protein